MPSPKPTAGRPVKPVPTRSTEPSSDPGKSKPSPVSAEPSTGASQSKEPLRSKHRASEPEPSTGPNASKASAEPTTSTAFGGAKVAPGSENASKTSAEPAKGTPPLMMSTEPLSTDPKLAPVSTEPLSGDPRVAPVSVEPAPTEQPVATDPLLGADAAPPQLKLKKEVGLFGAVGIITGVIVGSGIFVSPQFVIKDVGSPMMALIVWLSCGIYSTLGALCYAELGVMIPKSGGDYIYIYEAFGALPAFVFLWVAFIIINPTTIAIVALSFGTYMVSEFYGVNEEVPYIIPRMISFCLISILVALNSYKVRWSNLLQLICMVVKIVCMVSIILAAIIHLARGNTELMTKENFLHNANYHPSAFAMAFYGGIFSYAGWNYLNFVTEEIRSPEKNLPRAIYISLPLITFIYILLNTAYFVAIPAVVFPTVKAVAYTFAGNTMSFFRFIIPIGVCFSCMGTVNGMLFAVSRMFFAGARNGHLPEMLSMINVNTLTPMPSLISLGLMSFLYSLNPNMESLLGILSFSVSAIVAMGILALLKLRLWDKRNPNRSLKVFIGVPIVFFIACLYILIAPFFKEPILLAFASALMLSSIPVYFFFIYWKNKPRWLTLPWVKFTHFTQKLLLCATTEEEKKK